MASLRVVDMVLRLVLVSEVGVAPRPETPLGCVRFHPARIGKAGDVQNRTRETANAFEQRQEVQKSHVSVGSAKCVSLCCGHGFN